MSQDILLPFDESLLQLPSCQAVHIQLRPSLNHLTAKEYAEYILKLCQTDQSHLCGIIRKDHLQSTVLALAFYRVHPTTFDTIRFEIHDLIVDQNERNRGLGTRLFEHLIAQAKACGAPSLVLQCDLTNTNAHRFFFRQGLHISSFGFCLNRMEAREQDDLVKVLDVTDLPENENEQWLIRAQNVFRQLRPHLPADAKLFTDQIRMICRTGPARLLLAVGDNEGTDVLGLAVYRQSENAKYSKYIYCDDLITDENKRSSGVGRSLIESMKKEAQQLGLHRLVLDSGCQRGRAHKFYHREGFHIDQFEFAVLF